MGWKSICETPTVSQFSIINCETSVVGGTYIVGTLVDNTNYILLNVNVTQKGSYSIEATTEVGLYFQKSGSFPSPGTYTIAIPAYGSPIKGSEGSNKIAKISINGEAPICEIIIPIIEPATVKYIIANLANAIESDPITKELPTNGKKITLKLSVSVPGTTTLIARDKSNLNITYVAYNQVLENVEARSTDTTPSFSKTVTLHSTGGTVPSSYLNNTLNFRL